MPKRKNNSLTREEFLAAIKHMERRFEMVDKRFEEMDKRFEEMRKQSDKRFEEINKRFEEMDKRFMEMNMKFDALHDWVGVVVGHFQVRAGKNLEETVAGALRLALGMYDIEPKHLRLRQKIIDKDGEIGKKGKEYEIDIILKDGECYVFEVKSCPDKEDVERFYEKAELAKKVLKRRDLKKVLVTLAKDPYIQHLTKELNILLV